MEQRKFKRFQLHCQLIIQGTDPDGQPFTETTELINISGGGALFQSHLPDQYEIGQTVKASILLPGTPDLQGAMRTTAQIVAVGDRGTTRNKDRNGHSQVAIHFLEPFQILRDKQGWRVRQYGRNRS